LRRVAERIRGPGPQAVKAFCISGRFSAFWIGEQRSEEPFKSLAFFIKPPERPSPACGNRNRSGMSVPNPSFALPRLPDSARSTTAVSREFRQILANTQRRCGIARNPLKAAGSESHTGARGRGHRLAPKFLQQGAEASSRLVELRGAAQPRLRTQFQFLQLQLNRRVLAISANVWTSALARAVGCKSFRSRLLDMIRVNPAALHTPVRLDQLRRAFFTITFAPGMCRIVSPASASHPQLFPRHAKISSNFFNPR